MPLSIFAITGLVGWSMGVPWAVALLVADSLAPTDPVLASDVQVGPPKSGEEDKGRSGLTAEAGLNDGLASPFVHIAVTLAAVAGTDEPWLAQWFSYRVLWEVGAGVLASWLVGRAFGWLTFYGLAEKKLAQTGDGLVALSATLVSYGLAEIVHSYGFLAVLVAALTLRHAHREHDFQNRMYQVAEQIELLAMMVLLLLFGGALAARLLSPISWADAGIAAAILLAVRPAAGLFGLTGFRVNRSEKLTLAFFGIRGLGSFYCLAYGLNRMEAEETDRPWGLIGLVVLLSILLHGLTVTPIMRSLDRQQGRDPDAEEATSPYGPTAQVERA